MMKHCRPRKRLFLLTAAAAMLCLTCAAHASLNQGVVEFQAGQFVKAAQTLQSVVTQEPDNIAAQYWLGRAYLEARSNGPAETALKRVVEALPDSSEARYWLGIALARSGRPAEARAQFAKAAELDPGNKEARDALVELPEATLGLPNGRAGTTHSGGSTGTQVSIDTGGLAVDIGDVDLLTYNVHDYTFSSAPTDWIARSGTWAITNRWTCSPQWSWLGGYESDGIAALWSKREFTGDITIEAYLAFKMGLGTVNSYKNPTDLNISICADGANPSSGYSFMAGADKNHDSRIMKGTEILASSTKPEALLPIFEDGYPSTYEFHRKWWALRAHKRGDKLQFFMDGKLLCEATDPAPLTGGRVALWTYDKGIIISRVKIYYENELGYRSDVPGMDQILRPVTSLSDERFTISSSTYPSVQNDFEASVRSWQSRKENPRTQLRLVEPGADESGHCLAITNTASGGSFGTTVIPGSFVVDDLPVLSFDYRLPADNSVKVNLYCNVGGRLYETIFCGPEHGTPTARQIGAIRDVVADGKWHHAEFDLLGALKPHVSAGRPIKAQDLWIGNACKDGYLMAGFGGNHLGATYSLDNFTLDKPSKGDLKLSLNPASGAQMDGYSVVVDRQPNTEAPQGITTADSSFAFKPESGGTWYAHVAAKLKNADWTPTQHYQVRVDDTPPRVASANPASGSVLPDGPIQIVMADQGGSYVDLSSAKLTLNGKPIQMQSDAVSHDPQAQVLSLDPRRILPKIEDGAAVTVGIAGLKDRAGNAAAESANLTYKIAFASDKTPPPAPELRIGADGYLCNEDFENSIGGFTTYGGSSGAELSLDETTAASGRSSLRVYNPVEGGRFGIIRRGSFDAGKYRIVAFDYKVSSRLRVDLAVYVNGEMKGITFKDKESNLQSIGAVPGVKDDGQWHHTEFNLYDMLRKDDPTAASYIVNQFVIADWNWRANVEGQSYNIDNFQIIPVQSAATGLPMQWAAPDISGIAGLAMALTTSASADAPRTVTLPGSAGTVTNVANTDGWLHARVQDGAGNWGEASSQRVIVDSDAPAAGIVSPAAGAKTATSEIELQLKDTGVAGIDPASIQLEVAGTTYKVKKLGVGGLSFDAQKGKLVWSCEQVTPKPIVLPDGKPVSVSLKSARDYAGNAVTELPQWTWTMDYTQDKAAPQVVELGSNTHRTLLTNTFEDSLQGWRTHGGAAGAKVELDKGTAASGKASVKLTQQKAGGTMAAYITTEKFAAENYPVVAFDYKVPANVKLDIIARMADGTEYAIAFTDNPTGAIGRVSGVRADGTWRQASVDIAALLRPRVKQGSLDVVYLYFADRNNMDNPAGATAWFDNFIIGSVGTRIPVLRWKATDTTGIAGYSYDLDQEPGTEPDKASEGTAQSYRRTTKLDKGRWYFHIRALDGAGNWGPATHYALMHLSAS